MGNTTKLSRKISGAWGAAGAIYCKQSGTWVEKTKLWENVGGTWTGKYSKLSDSVNNSSVSGSASGGGSNGTVTSGSTTASPTNNIGTLTHSWIRYDGSTNINPVSSTAATTTFQATTGFSAAQDNGTSNQTARFYCRSTDGTTGAFVDSPLVSVSLTWTNTTPSFSPHSTIVSGAQTSSVQIPLGAGHVTIKVIGGGGGGGGSTYDIPSGEYASGMDGGHGGTNSGTYALSSSDWGQNITFTIGSGSSLWPAVAGTTRINGGVGAGLQATGGAGGTSGNAFASGAGADGTPDTLGGPPNYPYGYGGPGGSGGSGSSVGGDGQIIFEWNT